MTVAEHESARDAAINEMEELAVKWLQAFVLGEDTTVLAERMRDADKLSRKHEKKIRKLEKGKW